MKIVIIDDNKSVLRTLKLLLAPEFDQIVTMTDPRVLPALLAHGDVDAVILDMNFDNVSLDGKAGLFWLERIKETASAPAVIMITAFGDIQLAVEAMHMKADDFVTKPWDNDKLIATIKHAIEKNRKKNAEIGIMAEARILKQKNDSENSMTLDEIKTAHVKRIIDRCNGNLSKASEILGINRQTLYNLLKKVK